MTMTITICIYNYNTFNVMYPLMQFQDAEGGGGGKKRAAATTPPRGKSVLSSNGWESQSSRCPFCQNHIIFVSKLSSIFMKRSRCSSRRRRLKDTKKTTPKKRKKKGIIHDTLV